jgi:lipoprotein NlpD
MKQCIYIYAVVFLLSCVQAFADDSAADRAFTHVVKKNDTLYGISRSYGVSVDVLEDVNDITDPSKLRIGQELIIPHLYRVEKNDTYYGISRKFNISLQELLKANGRSENTILKSGETLYIPGPSYSAAGSGKTAADAQAGTSAAAAHTQDNETEAKNEEYEGRVAAETVSDSMPAAELIWPHRGERVELQGKLDGIAIKGTRGDIVYSVSSGTVFWAGSYGSYGKVVFVRSELGYFYFYGGNEELLVSVGDRVEPGVKIGTMGIDLINKIPQVYFGVYKDGRYVEPVKAPRI